MLRRRSTLLATAGLVLARPMVLNAQELTESAFPPLPEGMRADEPEFFSTNINPQRLGSVPATTAQRRTASEVLQLAPNQSSTPRPTPYQVALFFLNLGLGQIRDAQGNLRPDWAPYAGGWPREYNPIIEEMFAHMGPGSAAMAAEEGDNTAWCAAFLHYCIARAQTPAGQPVRPYDRFGRPNASSGSFRCWGEEVFSGSSNNGKTGTPRRGDIVVWAVRDTVNGCNTGQGHVGFFEAFSPTGVWVVGGNQGRTNTNRSAVTRRMLETTHPRGATTQSVHSIRTSDILHA